MITVLIKATVFSFALYLIDKVSKNVRTFWKYILIWLTIFLIYASDVFGYEQTWFNVEEKLTQQQKDEYFNLVKYHTDECNKYLYLSNTCADAMYTYFERNYTKYTTSILVAALASKNLHSTAIATAILTIGEIINCSYDVWAACRSHLNWASYHLEMSEFYAAVLMWDNYNAEFYYNTDDDANHILRYGEHFYVIPEIKHAEFCACGS